MKKVIILTIGIALLASTVFGAATVQKGKTFTSNETVTNTKLHTLVDSATIANVDQTNVAANYGLTEKSSTQPSDTDSLWVDSSNNCAKAYVSGAYEEIGSTPATLSTTTITATDKITATDAVFTESVTLSDTLSVNSSIYVGQVLGDLTASGNTIYQQNIVKAWGIFQTDSTIDDSFNISHIVDSGTGDYTLHFATNFANTTYVCVGSVGNTLRVVELEPKTAGTVDCNIFRTSDGNPFDNGWAMIAIGDQ